MIVEQITFSVTAEISHGEQRDDLYKGRCAHCGKALYEGDSVHKTAFGTFCADCFFGYIAPDILTIA